MVESTVLFCQQKSETFAKNLSLIQSTSIRLNFRTIFSYAKSSFEENRKTTTDEKELSLLSFVSKSFKNISSHLKLY